MLAYPIISFVVAYHPGAFLGSVGNFFGRAGVSEDIRSMVSNELHANAEHPPVFIWSTREDSIVPYLKGPHGLGLAQSQPGELGAWTDSLLQRLA